MCFVPERGEFVENVAQTFFRSGELKIVTFYGKSESRNDGITRCPVTIVEKKERIDKNPIPATSR